MNTETHKKPPRKPYAIRFAESGMAAIDATAAELGTDRSDFIRQACAEKIARHRAGER